MSAIIVPIEIQLTERSQAILAALSGAIGTTQEPATASASAVDLQPGEHYAGVVLDESGQVTHHLVLMAQRPDTKLKWQAAMDWAASAGGALPTRQEQALLYANCKPHLKPEWHWISESYDASYAWTCHFHFGGQGTILKSYECAAVAVRLIPLTV
jgi:hypothetical protein